jgi:hypothetical protein
MADVSGLFFIDMGVLDGSGKSILQLDASTANPRHVIWIENISGVTQSAWVYASLPNRTLRIEFVKNGIAQTNWDDRVLNIPGGAQRELGCDLRRNGGPPGNNEPLQCDRIDKTQGSLPWIRLWRGLPQHHLINVS